MDNIILLSEIHPAGVKIYNPLDQAYKWYGLITPTMGQVLKRTSMSFIEAIFLIYEQCQIQNKTLVVRDWTHFDFTPAPFNYKPTYQLTTANTLGQIFDLQQLCLVRNPIPQWESLSKLAVYKGGIENYMSLEDYLSAYHKFAIYSENIGFVRYEDFVVNPETAMKQACDKLGLTYDKDFINKWHENTAYTGDVNNRTTIDPPKSKYIIDEKFKNRVDDNDDYRKVLELLGY